MEDLPVPWKVNKHTKERNGRSLHRRLDGGSGRRNKKPRWSSYILPRGFGSMLRSPSFLRPGSLHHDDRPRGRGRRRRRLACNLQEATRGVNVSTISKREAGDMRRGVQW